MCLSEIGIIEQSTPTTELPEVKSPEKSPRSEEKIKSPRESPRSRLSSPSKSAFNMINSIKRKTEQLSLEVLKNKDVENLIYLI